MACYATVLEIKVEMREKTISLGIDVKIAKLSQNNHAMQPKLFEECNSMLGLADTCQPNITAMQ